MKIIKEAVLESGERVSAEDLALINTYSKKQLEAEEVFTFSVLLCDNETDRDGENFSVNSLYALSEMFTGKTGIFDHNWSTKTQVARIYKTEVVFPMGENTSYGDPYAYLKAGVYMMNSEENKSLIADINGGIKKEVSVGCSVKRITCNICGNELGSDMCPHAKGQEYGGKLCRGILEEPADAYEWSFVAVPAQKNAGVIKRFGAGGNGLSENVKMLGSECEKEYSELKMFSELGKKYLEKLYEETVELGVKSGIGFSKEFLEKTLRGRSEEELQGYKSVFEKKLDEAFPPVFQLYKAEDKKEKFTGEEFLI